MKKNVLLIGIFLNLAFILSLNAQSQFENPSFEDWEDVGLSVDEPVNWSSIKTSDNTVTNPLAPVVWGQSNDAHTGTYSLKCYNVETLGSIVASGTVTNGRIHADFNPENGYGFTDINDPQWNTPCIDRPDSVVVWVKYFPMLNDVGRVRVILHTGEALIPDSTMTNWIGEANIHLNTEMDVWTRMSAPFVYINNNTPEYILMLLYSGNGTTPVKDSWALFDDVELIYNPQAIEEQSLGEINIYSQHDLLTINWESVNSANSADMKILDLSGRSIWTGRITQNEKTTIQLNIPKGVYICHISDGRQVYSQKILMP